MENKTNINDRSINTAGITTDYKQAVAEFIWNGFDARATQIDIRFDRVCSANCGVCSANCVCPAGAGRG